MFSQPLIIFSIFTTLIFDLVVSDIYLHNPPGSNNRLDEDKRNRQNANRLFDSQNNNRGGYNVGSLYYYQGSKLSIEWTNQHSCNDVNSHCDIVIQYMCSDTLRDGATTKTIPLKPSQCINQNCSADLAYGMHEDFFYYLNCLTRERNQGLFTSDQLKSGVKGSATKTRQNPQGTRRGYECPEERDYYPYWHPSPWIDVAILTNNATRCPMYQTESANVKPRSFCYLPPNVVISLALRKKLVPNNEVECLNFVFSDGQYKVSGVWKEILSPGYPAPDCRETEFSRDNHLGNGVGGQPLMYNWTIPNNIQLESCALRIRYNISTADYNDSGDISKPHNLPTSEAQKRGYVLKNNPVVDIFHDLDLELRLAINTAQYGRTFQDRSHRFAIRPRTENLNSDATIQNLNVRGKRGNIVQVYPAVEYDFVPNVLNIGENDHVHFQWTGSNTNPGNNDGQGRLGSDRSNIVLLGNQTYIEGSILRNEKHGHWGRSYPSNDTSLLGLEPIDIERLAFLRDNQLGGELSELDDAGTYFDLGPRKITQRGEYHYFCTRNNNFSNRSQKGKIFCGSHMYSAAIGWNGGVIEMEQGVSVSVERGTFAALKKMSIVFWSPEQTMNRVKSLGRTLDIGDGFAGDVVVIHPEEKLTIEGKHFTVEMGVRGAGAFSKVTVYTTTSDSFVTWTKVDADIGGGKATFQTDRGGVYAAFHEKNLPLIVGLTMTIIVIFAIIIGSIIYFRRNPSKWTYLTTTIVNAKLSTQNRI